MSLTLQLRLARSTFTLDVDLSLPARGISVLYGPSGSGKTSLLRCVAGLERAQGHVRIGGETWQDDRPSSLPRTFIPTHQRPLGYVFQEASLFAHLDVKANLAYGHRRARANPRTNPQSEPFAMAQAALAIC
jgi:molybdate transport system ATP-binding protein